VLVTCSSIGEAVEEAAARLDVPVLRVDAAMAEEAVRRAADAASAGGASAESTPGGTADHRPSARIAVLATNTATLGPTGRLLEREADRQGVRAEVSSEVVAGAAAARAAGDAAEHDRLVADAVRAAGADADVIVLAQASMADAAALAGVDAPVLTSPAGGVAALVAAVRGERADGGAGGDA